MDLSDIRLDCLRIIKLARCYYELYAELGRIGKYYKKYAVEDIHVDYQPFGEVWQNYIARAL
jgi:hypothetical protein